MTGVIKILAEKRGPLQGMTVEDILRQAYSPEARYVPDPTTGYEGMVVRARSGDGTFDILDQVIAYHDTDDAVV